MARKRNPANERARARQERYRQKLARMREPEAQALDTACAKALAQLLLRTESREIDPSIIKRIVLDARKSLIDDGYEIEVSGELLHRRIRFLKHEISSPEAGSFERRMWSPPVPSRRPPNMHLSET